MAALHEIQYKAWMVYDSNEDALEDLGANDTPWHYQGNEYSTSRPHRVQVTWSKKESNPTEAGGFHNMHKWPPLVESVNPDATTMWLYTEWAGYSTDA